MNNNEYSTQNIGSSIETSTKTLENISKKDKRFPVNKTLLLGILGVSVGLAAGLTSTALYTNAQANLTNSNSPTTSSVATITKTRPQPTAEQIQKKQAVETAISDGNYEAWKTAIKDAPNSAELLKQIDTKEKFDKFIEAHKLVQEAHTKAEAIYKELGLENTGKGKGFGHRGLRHQAT